MTTIPPSLSPIAVWNRAGAATCSVLEQVEALADREDVAAYPVAVRALRNVGGLRWRPPHEIALGLITLGVVIATDSIVVDLAANIVAVLFVNHPHEPTAAPGAVTTAA